MTIIGKAPINTFAFITAKISFLFVFVTPLISLFYKPLIIFQNQITVILSGLFLFTALIFLFFSSVTLGKSTKMGLPEEKTELKTKGIYRLSRNPMYFGLYFICFASVLFTANPVVFVLTIYIIIVHHLIIKSEEKFLAKRFGKSWNAYQSEVGRYL